MTNAWIKAASALTGTSFCSFVEMTVTSLADEVLLGWPQGRLWGAQVVLKVHWSRWASLLFFFFNIVCKMILSECSMLCTNSAQVPDCTLPVISSVTATVSDGSKKPRWNLGWVLNTMSLFWKETPRNVIFPHQKESSLNSDLTGCQYWPLTVLSSICLWSMFSEGFREFVFSPPLTLNSRQHSPSGKYKLISNSNVRMQVSCYGCEVAKCKFCLKATLFLWAIKIKWKFYFIWRGRECDFSNILNIYIYPHTIILNGFFYSVNKFWFRCTFLSRLRRNYMFWCQANSCMLYHGHLMKEVLSCSSCFTGDKFCLMQVVVNCIFLSFIIVLIC